MKIFLFFVFFPFVEQYWYILKHVTKLSFDSNFVHKGGLSITLKNHVQATGYILNSFLHQVIQLHCLQIYKYLFRFALFKYRIIYSFTFGPATQEIILVVNAKSKQKWDVM